MADNIVNGIKVPFLPVGGVERLKDKTGIKLPPERAFETIFKRELDQIKFSKHAQQRLDERNISLDTDDINRLKSAVSKAEEKGARESLVLLRNTAFIISISNKTVVTAMDSENMQDNVVTNIDSAVIIQNTDEESTK